MATAIITAASTVFIGLGVARDKEETVSFDTALQSCKDVLEQTRQNDADYSGWHDDEVDALFEHVKRCRDPYYSHKGCRVALSRCESWAKDNNQVIRGRN